MKSKFIRDSKFLTILLDHKLFIGFLIAFTLLTVGCLVYGEFFSTQQLTVKEISLYPVTRPPAKMPLEINIVKGDFTDKELQALDKAASSWYKNTDGLINIKLNKNWEAPSGFIGYQYINNNGFKTMWKGNADKQEFLMLQLTSSLCADGISTGDVVVIFDSYKELTSDKLFIIAAHEWGHQLGMEHIKQDYPSLMNIGGNSGVISTYDMIMLCSLYQCK